MEPNRFHSPAFSRLSSSLWNESDLMRNVQQWIQRGKRVGRRNWRQRGIEVYCVTMRYLTHLNIIENELDSFCSHLRITKKTTLLYSNSSLHPHFHHFSHPMIPTISHFPSFLPHPSITFPIPFSLPLHSPITSPLSNPQSGVSCLKSANQVKNQFHSFLPFSRFSLSTSTHHARTTRGDGN